MKKRLVVGIGVAMAMLLPASVSAHVVVKPAEVLTGNFQSFTVGVPNEKDVPVSAVKLLIPDNMQFVTPTVKNGWTIDVEKEGTGEAAKVKSISWSGGTIPAGLRDDFGFSAKTPDTTTEIQWKAYQTYENGTTVAWDQKPSNEHSEGGDSGPYSVTKVAATGNGTHSQYNANAVNDSLARMMSIAALFVGFTAFIMASRNKAAAAAAQVASPKKSKK